MKKVLATILAMVLLCSITAVAYASPEPSSEAESPSNTCVVTITVRAKV